MRFRQGFHLQEESPHCINMTRSEDFQAYLRQLVLAVFEMDVESMGGTDMKAKSMAKIIESFYWVLQGK